MKQWTGRAVANVRAYMATKLPATCGRCLKPVTADQPWVVGHIKSRTAYPELTWDPANWQHEHKRCSDQSARQATLERAARFPHQLIPRATELAAVSLPVGHRVRDGQLSLLELEWDPDLMRRCPWLAEFADVPDDASPPLAMTPPAPDAVCSYGWSGCTHHEGAAAVAWIEETQRIRLRWWQRLATVRQLEHRADGSLTWDKLVESGPRRIGKSVRIRGMALWRLAVGPSLFGETQVVMHTGSDIAICRQIQKAAWRWAELYGWTVRKSNGKEAIETGSADEWLVRAQTAVYGYDVTYGVVDESWDVAPDTVSEGLEPGIMERQSPQLHETSTAHRRATSLMRTEISEALAGNDPGTLLLLWAAPAGADPGDPGVWRAASPHWSEARRALIARKYEKALNGEQDKELDDPDPMRGFESQYLNRWQLKESRVSGQQLTTSEAWRGLVEVAPDRPADVVAVEGWFHAGVAIARAWRLGPDRVLVAATSYDDLTDAAEALDGWRGRVLIGASLADDPSWRELRIRTMSRQGTVRAVVGKLSQLLRDDVLRHTGDAFLSGQVLEVRIMPGVDGPRVRSTGRADAVKAAVWAVEAARRTAAKPRVIVANRQRAADIA